MNRWLSLGVVCSTLTLATPCLADIYYFEQNGVMNFTDECTQPRCKVFLKDRKGAKGRVQVVMSPRTPRAVASQINFIRSSSGVISVTSVPRYFNSQPPVRMGRVNEANRQLYTPHINQVAKTYGLEPSLLHAVIAAESSYNPNAVSNKGAMGLMQLMPGTARRFNVSDPFDPVSNLHGGAQYLRWLIDRFNNLNLAIAAYNAGEGAVEKYGNSIPPYQETQTYVNRVLNYYNRHQGVN